MTQKNDFQQIVEFVYKMRWNYEKPLTPQITLEDDLGISGDDAVEFMEAFFDEFNVDASRFIFEDYFTLEGGGLINFRWLFGLESKPKKSIPISLGHLQKIVQKKVWDKPNLI